MGARQGLWVKILCKHLRLILHAGPNATGLLYYKILNLDKQQTPYISYRKEGKDYTIKYVPIYTEKAN